MFHRAREFGKALLPAILAMGCAGCGELDFGSSPGDLPASVAAPLNDASNHAPTILMDSTAVAHVGVTYDYQPQATDPDGDTLRFTANNLPPWASMDPNTGRITGTPGENDLGEYESITIVVADAARRTESVPFTITVLT